ncbi:MAG: Right handed beta helix region [Solirubrobacteraceae bacterium]
MTEGRAAGALAALAAALLLVGCGQGRAPSGPPGMVLHVDADRSRCDDGRTAAQARSAQTPLCSIARAVRLAPADAEVVVARGSYPALELDRSHGDRLTIRSDGAGAVRLPRIAVGGDASGVAFEGLELTGSPDGPTFDLAPGTHDVQLVRSRVTATQNDAVVLSAGVGHVTVAGNLIHTSRAGSGVTFASTSTRPGAPPGAPNQAPIRHVVIRGNHFDGIAVDAIRPTNFDHLLIEGNEIEGVVEHGQHADAIQTVFGGSDLVVRHNFIHDNVAQGVFINDGRVTGAVIEDNVIVRNRAELALQLFDTVGLTLAGNTIWDNEHNVILRVGVRDAVVTRNIFQDMVVEDPASAARDVRQDHNVIAGGWNWGARGAHDISARPTFVDPARRDYRLAATSAGRGAGACAATGHARAWLGCAAPAS